MKMKRTYENILSPIGAFIGALAGSMIGSRITVEYKDKTANGRILFNIMGWLAGYLIFNKIGSEIDRRKQLTDCCGCDDFDDDDFDFIDFDDED